MIGHLCRTRPDTSFRSTLPPVSSPLCGPAALLLLRIAVHRTAPYLVGIGCGRGKSVTNADRPKSSAVRKLPLATALSLTSQLLRTDSTPVSAVVPSPDRKKLFPSSIVHRLCTFRTQRPDVSRNPGETGFRPIPLHFVPRALQPEERFCYQLALVTPGIKPLEAISRNWIRLMPNRRM